MGQTRTQYIPNVTIQSGITTYPRYIGEVLPHPFIQNTLLEVLEVWDGSEEVWGNLSEPIPFPYGSESNPVTRDWNTPPPHRDESSKYPIYKCRVNGAREQWIIFKWILLDENRPTDLLGYSNIQTSSGNALDVPPPLPELVRPVRTEVTGWSLPMSFEAASWTATFPLWTPSLITTDLWLDASDVATVTLVSSAVSQWSDKSGNSRNVSQGSSGARPTYTTSQSLNFDGGNDSLTRAAVLQNSFTLFAVAKNNSSANSLMLAQYLSAGSAGRTAIYIENNTTRLMGFATGTFGGITGTPNGLFNLFTWVKNGTTATNSYNGGSSTSSVTVNSTVDNTTFEIGGASFISDYLACSISEIIVCNSVISESDKQKAEGYLAWKWNLVSRLPSGHPYKTSPPYA